ALFLAVVRRGVWAVVARSSSLSLSVADGAPWCEQAWQDPAHRANRLPLGRSVGGRAHGGQPQRLGGEGGPGREPAWGRGRAVRGPGAGGHLRWGGGTALRRSRAGMMHRASRQTRGLSTHGASAPVERQSSSGRPPPVTVAETISR